MPGFLERDVRVDFCRGLALIFIFLDHIRDNRFALLTMHKYGLSDAAEVFVLLAGFSSALAYGPTVEASGFAAGARKALGRVRTIYVAHLLTLAVGVVLMAGFNYHFRSHDYGGASQFEALVKADWPQTVIHAMMLKYQPDLFNILPLYIVLLTGFPFFYRLIEKSPSLALGGSLALWVVAKVTHVNLSSEPGGAGWYFDPLAWQLLFVIGVVAGYGRLHGWTLPRSTLLFATAAVIAVIGIVVVAPWTEIPGWQNTRLIPRGTLGAFSKTYLSAWRLVHILALTYLAACSVAPGASWLQSGVARAIATSGRHSLEVFCLGIVLSIVGGGMIQEIGRGFFVELTVSAGGIALMGATAGLLARSKNGVRARKVHAAPRLSPPPSSC